MAGEPEIYTSVTRYTVSVFPPELWDHIDAYSYLIFVEETASGRWAIRRPSRCLNADGHWDYEPTNSERTEEWLAVYRHDKETALRLAAEAAPKVRVNGKTATEMLAWVLLDAAVEPLLPEDGESE